MISANINFQILLCHSPIMLFSFLRNSFYAVSNPIIPFRILLFIFLILLCHYEFFLFSFQFYYSLSNYVMQFSNPIIRLYSPLMQFRILLFPFKFCYSLFQFYYAIMNSVIQFPIVLFAFELCSSKSGTSFNKLYFSRLLCKIW